MAYGLILRFGRLRVHVINVGDAGPFRAALMRLLASFQKYRRYLVFHEAYMVDVFTLMESWCMLKVEFWRAVVRQSRGQRTDPGDRSVPGPVTSRPIMVNFCPHGLLHHCHQRLIDQASLMRTSNAYTISPQPR